MTQIAALSGCKFASITTLTSVKIPKTFMVGGEVTKQTTKQVQINYSYENAVNNRLIKEGKAPTFTANSLPWGEWLIPNKIIAHNGKCYLRLYEYKGAKHETKYFVNGKEPNEYQIIAIKEYEQSKRKPSTTQGLTQENEVIPTCVAEENILAFSCGDIQYQKAEKTANAMLS